MPKGDFFMKFRDEDEAFIGYDVDMSGPGSGCAVEWWFKDRDGAAADALNVTPEEEQAIVDRCVEVACGQEREPMEGDVPVFGTRDPAKQIGTPISELSGHPGHRGYAEFVRIAKTWGYD